MGWLTTLLHDAKNDTDNMEESAKNVARISVRTLPDDLRLVS